MCILKLLWPVIKKVTFVLCSDTHEGRARRAQSSSPSDPCWHSNGHQQQKPQCPLHWAQPEV